MTYRILLLGLLACGALVACGPKKADAPAAAPAESEAPAQDATIAEAGDEAEPAAIDTDDDLCKASAYRSLIGTNAAAVTLPADLVHRIYKNGDAVTADYNAARLNITTDVEGVITEVKCG